MLILSFSFALFEKKNVQFSRSALCFVFLSCLEKLYGFIACASFTSRDRRPIYLENNFILSLLLYFPTILKMMYVILTI